MIKQRKKKKENKFGTFSKKWAKWLEGEEEFVTKAQQSTAEELDEMIVLFNERITEKEQEMESDSDLKARKEELKELLAPYKECLKINEAKSRYCIAIKESQGKAASDSDDE